jgi:hypothetical protein
LSFFIIAGCNNIPGTYVANYKAGTDTLKIFNDNRYARVCYPNAPKDIEHTVDSGTWSISKGEIYFRNWCNRTDAADHSEETQPGIRISEFDRNYFIGKLRIAIDYDMGYYYVKQ